MASAMMTILWGMLLTALVIYMFSIYITDLMRGLAKVDENLERYWGGLSASCFTLFQVFTVDGWSDVARPAIEVYPSLTLYFILFISLTYLVIMNVVVAVIVEHVIKKALHDEEARAHEAKRHFEASIDSIAQAFSHIDTDDSRLLSKA